MELEDAILKLGGIPNISEQSEYEKFLQNLIDIGVSKSDATAFCHILHCTRVDDSGTTDEHIDYI